MEPSDAREHATTMQPLLYPWFTGQGFQGADRSAAMISRITFFGEFVTNHMDFTQVVQAADVEHGLKCSLCCRAFDIDVTEAFTDGTLLDTEAAIQPVVLVGSACEFGHAAHRECVVAAIHNHTTHSRGASGTRINPMQVSLPKILKVADISEDGSKFIVRRDTFPAGCPVCAALFPRGYEAFEACMRRDGFDNPRSIVPLLQPGPSALFPIGGTAMIRTAFSFNKEDADAVLATGLCPGTLVDFGGYRALSLTYVGPAGNIIPIKQDDSYAGYGFVPQELVYARGIPALMTHPAFGRSLVQYQIGTDMFTAPAQLRSSTGKSSLQIPDPQNLIRTFFEQVVVPAGQEKIDKATKARADAEAARTKGSASRLGFGLSFTADPTKVREAVATQRQIYEKACSEEGVFVFTADLVSSRTTAPQVSDELRQVLEVLVRNFFSSLPRGQFSTATGDHGELGEGYEFLSQGREPAVVEAFTATPELLESCSSQLLAELMAASGLYLALPIECSKPCSTVLLCGKAASGNCMVGHDIKMTQTDRENQAKADQLALDVLHSITPPSFSIDAQRGWKKSPEGKKFMSELSERATQRSVQEYPVYCTVCGAKGPRHLVHTIFAEAKAKMRKPLGGSPGFSKRRVEEGKLNLEF